MNALFSSLFPETRDKITNLRDDIMDGEDSDSLYEFKEIWESLFNVVCVKADQSCIENWSPVKLKDFFGKALWILGKNEISAIMQKGELKTLLKDPIYLQAAYIAQDVYCQQSSELPGGWRRSQDFADIEFCNEETGLVSCLYERDVFGRKEYIYATAGTNPINIIDWKNNINQLYGQSEQYEAAARNAIELSNRIGDAGSLTFVGHSQGGGLATNNSIHTGRRAIVFNPAAVSAETSTSLTKMPIADADKNVVVFMATNDVLNWLQDTAQLSEGLRLIVPATCGNRFYIHTQSKSPIKSHLMDQMIETLETLKG